MTLRTTRRPSARGCVLGASLVVALGGCADLIGASFDDYGVAPPGDATSSTANSTASASSASSAGGEGGGDGGGSPTTSSTSTGADCVEWPAGSGEWAWAAQVGDTAGDLEALEASALVQVGSSTYPWAVVGTFIGTLFSGSPHASSATRPTPFVIPIGAAGVDADGATTMPCDEDCIDAQIRDAASDPPTFGEGDVSFWGAGSFTGSFLGVDAELGESPFITRFFADDRSAAWSPGTSWTSTFEGEADVSPIDAVAAQGGSLAFAGRGSRMTMFDLTDQGDSRYWVAVARSRPLLLSRRAGWIGAAPGDNTCGENLDVAHQHEIDVELQGDTAWVTGRYCGRLAFAESVGNEPGDGFVGRLDVTEGDSSVLDFDGSPALAFGSPAIAVTAEDDTRAFVVGEVDPLDLTKSLPGDSSIFATTRDVWITRVDHEERGLTARWTVQLEVPGDQHVHDVAVRRFGGNDDDLDVFVVGSSSEPIEVNGYASSCRVAEGRVGFVASLSALDGSIRWIRSFGRSQAEALEIAASADGVVVVGRPGPGGPVLSPTAAGDAAITLSDLSPSLFVGELTR